MCEDNFYMYSFSPMSMINISKHLGFWHLSYPFTTFVLITKFTNVIDLLEHIYVEEKSK